MKKVYVLMIALFAFAVSAAAAEWTVDKPHSSLNFSTKHLVVSTVRGEFTQFDGTISLDPKDLSTIQATMTAQIASVNTNEPKRDDHLRSSDFFDAEHHPTMTFVSKQAVQSAPGKATLTGDLTIRGVTKEVTFDVEGFNQEIKDPWGMVRVGGTATTTINRMDYGVNWNTVLEAGGLVVSENVKITVELELTRPAQ